MKRIRDDPNEYLGGDLTTDISFVENEDGDDKRPATKAERNAKRRQANKEWKVSDRLVDSGIDPNPRHTLYYKQQLPCLNVEWNDFQESLCTPLPVTFRFGGGCPKIVESSIKKRVADEFRTMRGRYVELNGTVLTDNIVKPISWCKSWQIAADSASLARSEALAPLYNLLCREVSLGNVVRQELASMIPVLLLDVQHHHTVLDVCAAPGSKTEQILAAMQHHGEKEELGTVCSGMVVANDADPKRILTLKKRYSRCGRPNLLINCSRAEDLYRSIKGKFKFDRIVADVPCSGDGTFRKFSHLWRLFRPRVSLELHLIQLQIAKASALMLKAGGRMIYSTCSINPLEDEAVVAALLLYCGGKLTLVDVEKEGLLPGLRKRPGVSHWLCDDEIFTIGEPDDSARLASKSRLTAFCPSMYPPVPEVAAQLHLDRCVRILPHDQDTGGFFVAVLQMLGAGETATPIVLPPIVTVEPVQEEEIEGERDLKAEKKERTEKKTASGISEARTLQTFKSLGFNAKSRQKEKAKKDKNKGKEEVKVKLDSTRCTMYEALGPAFTHAKGLLHFNESNLCDGLLGMTLSEGKKSTALGEDIAASCCLVIATADTIPEVIEKKSVDEEGGLSKEEEEKMKLKKLQQKSRDSNGIFGSRSTGWLKVVENEAEEIIEGPYKRVQMVSRCVESALRTWARSDMVIQAGVTVCHHQESSGSWRVEPDGARAFLPHIEREKVIYLSPSDFSFFLMLRAEVEGEESSLAVMFQKESEREGESEGEGGVSIEVEVEIEGNVLTVEESSSGGDVCLSADGRRRLWADCAKRLELIEPPSTVSLVIAIQELSGTTENHGNNWNSGNNGNSEDPSQPKRRISKAERKNLKSSKESKGSRSNDKVETHAEGLEIGMVLVLTVSYNTVDDSYEGIRLLTATSEDVCRSYMTALSSLKI